MNKILFIVLGMMFVPLVGQACVTHNPKNDTYTVDAYGCVNHFKDI